MELAKQIFIMQLEEMKNLLKLMEFKFEKNSDQFKYVKEQIMNFVYDGARKFYTQGAKDGVFEKCSCGANLRHGWTNCEYCAGSGFRDFLNKEVQ